MVLPSLPKVATTARFDVELLFGVRGPIVLMGHSIAGVYIRAYAARYPEQLSGLIFVGGSTPLQEERPAFKALSKGPSPEMQLLLMKSLSILGMPRIKGQWSSVTPGFEPHAGKLLAEENCRPPVTGIRSEMDGVNRSGQETVHTGPFDELPILIFSEDPADTPSALANDWNQMQEDLKSLSTRSQRIIAKGSGHYIQMERPELSVKEVTVFIQQLRGKSQQRCDYGSTKAE